MTSAALPLFELQELDTRIDSEVDSLMAIERQLKGDPLLDAASKREAELDASLAAAQLELRKLDAEATDLSATSKKLNETLYGGSIHDTRELHSLQAQIDHAAQRRSDLEDREIELMERVELLEVQAEEAQKGLEALTVSRQTGLESLRVRLTEHQNSLEALRNRRKELAADVPGPRLHQYDRLRARLGHAVSAVDHGICQWCRVQLPSGDVQHARGEALVSCTNCGRILFVPE